MFNKNMHNWKSYSLKQCKYMLAYCPAPIPWWYSEDATEVIAKLKAHDAALSLGQRLTPKSIKAKLKI